MVSIQFKKINIVDLDTDIIVNAANEHLVEGSGVCGAIFAEAGRVKLAEACKTIGYCKTGSAVITPGFDLNSKYIIHAVGPKWTDGNHGEPSLLYDAYKSSLELAKANKCHSIGFPLISAGIYGCPVDISWRKGIRACQTFERQNPNYDIKVVFAVLSDSVFSVGEKVRKAIEYEDKSGSHESKATSKDRIEIFEDTME